LDLLEWEPRLAQVAEIAALLEAGLAPCRAMANVRDVRVMWAIGVVELRSIADLAALKAGLAARSVWVRPFRNVVYLTPALTMGAEGLARLCAAVVEVARLNQ
jgi:adenosylmethionine-8-amino-7-oxononanoate aminotransferase